MRKNCAQIVCRQWDKLVGLFAQLLTKPVDDSLFTALLWVKSVLYPRVYQAFTQHLYTWYLSQLYLLKRYLSPSSTAPITTTTTYI